jgi:large subunit ribosomal protein L3
MKAVILGKKIGMTSYYGDDGQVVPCTVIEAGPCPVVQIKTKESDGYNAIQLGFEAKSEAKSNKPKIGHFKKAGVAPMRLLKEFRDAGDDFALGQNMTVEQFEAGDFVKLVGNSKGKGFQGVMKRHGFAGVGMATHGQKDRQRHGGSIGQSSYPSRVLKGTKMPGRMGNTRITVKNIEILDVVADQNLLILKGSVPGGRNSYLEIIKNS